ncbi:UbiA prenyltransferase family protein [Lentzea tibetensis]|uniref:UbiA prenyltransferase family protein n=1 Tax=Lentzea tibetensis TaxID=2591470 RepID=UPI00164840AF|nr:UbiA family prenyltransferase [Lentzea tibetensis]
MSALIRVHRLEHPFGLHYLCCATWGACYAVRFDLVVFFAIAANFLVIVSGNPLNALADVRNDAATREKRHLVAAVNEIGRHRVAALTAAEMVIALAVATIVSWKAATGVALIILLYLAYNLEPLRLKRRGYAGPVALSIAAGLLPSVIAYSAAGGQPEPAIWLVFVGVCALGTARALWWAVPDRVGDAAVGSLTPVVLHGKQHALSVAARITVVGLLLLGGGLWLRYGPWWALLGVSVSATFLLARELPTSKMMLRYGMTLVVCATAVVASIPLLA